MTSDATCAVHWIFGGSGHADDTTLSRAERQRAAWISSPAARSRFVAATTLTRAVLATELGTDPRHVDLERRCAACRTAGHGKPFVRGLRLGISITHAGNLVGIALSRSGEVGLDAETRGRDISNLAHRFLGRGERAVSASDHLVYWTRKEAVVKATGDGIGVGMDAVLVTRPTEAPALLDYPGRPERRVAMAELRCHGDYVACVAVTPLDRIVVTEHWHPSRAS